LVQSPVELPALPQLGELAVAAAQLGEQGWLTSHLAEADELLDRVGRPVLWDAPLRWYRMQAALAAGRPADVAHHAEALAATADASPYAAVLGAAAGCWTRILAGAVDVEEVLAVDRRMHAVCLGWEAAQMAGHCPQPTSGSARSGPEHEPGSPRHIAR